MLSHYHHRVIAATDKALYFSKDGNLNPNSGLTELGLAPFVAQEFDGRVLALFQEARSNLLLIVPDHWFKHEFFLFKSPRNSLIKPFIERKLKTAYPNLPAAQDFFSFSFRQRAATGPGVRAFHLYEPVFYDLYAALCNAHLTPRWITTAALLWEERLRLRIPEFPTQAAMLVHLHAQGAFLYFYFQGDFLFSRTVALPESAERWDALLFEVNQSIYLFSQKAKSDLNQIYLIGNEAGFQQRLSDVLGRPVQLIAGDSPAKALPRELAHLEALLDQNGVAAPGDAYSVTHSRVQQEVKWRPIQWVGMVVAAVLLLFFVAENQWLDERLQDEIIVRSQMRRQQPITLADYDVALLELTEDAKRPSAAHTISKIISSLPEDVLINEFKMDSDAVRLDVSATVYVDTVDRFRSRLKLLIDALNRKFKLDPAMTIEDMVFNLEEMKNPSHQAHYKISWKILLP
ncbi:MAG: hypothetical protein MUC57_01990 [Desulfobacterales bacterium]|jgi:hypothetical protein|nr:hypothetical protein [Desulfobacterales bacterium]